MNTSDKVPGSALSYRIFCAVKIATVVMLAVAGVVVVSSVNLRLVFSSIWDFLVAVLSTDMGPVFGNAPVLVGVIVIGLIWLLVKRPFIGVLLLNGVVPAMLFWWIFSDGGSAFVLFCNALACSMVYPVTRPSAEVGAEYFMNQTLLNLYKDESYRPELVKLIVFFVVCFLSFSALVAGSWQMDLSSDYRNSSPSIDATFGLLSMLLFFSSLVSCMVLEAVLGLTRCEGGRGRRVWLCFLTSWGPVIGAVMGVSFIAPSLYGATVGALVGCLSYSVLGFVFSCSGKKRQETAQ